MVSLFNLDFEDQDKMIKFLTSSYSDMELFSLLRQLNIEKNEVYSKYFTTVEFCEKIVETISKRELSEKLLLLLQSKEFYRERLINDFKHLDLVEPLTEEKFSQYSNRVYDVNGTNTSVNDWVHECKNKLVLILGKDSPEENMEELENISGVVERMGYQPILIKKQPEIEVLTNEEKMLAYASLSRFIIIEKSVPAGQIDEAKICAVNRFAAIWIQKENTGDTWMQGDYEVDSKNIKVFKYTESTLEECLSESVRWVESYLEDKTMRLNKLYPWR
ncbi:hypothetical protein V1503_07790 [Bacillus sp. SCS-151]|uniref:hypothetical protein n=1 Tax=Nanhaiella sioensis TaxID=3115293 RepID=UPI00397977EE